MNHVVDKSDNINKGAKGGDGQSLRLRHDTSDCSGS